tara:strand:- start:258 stop:1697 length:1440 start_codon:yes stop_codon:yes gene_type:complete
MAELLAQQGSEDIKVESVNGVPTPISPFQGLAKALQSGMGGYLAGKAAADEAALEKLSLEEALKARKGLSNFPGTKGQFRVSDEDPGTTATPMEMDMPTIPGQEPSGEKVKYTLDMPNMPKTEIGGGARPYEDQIRLLDEYDLSSNPAMQRMAASARGRIEAENLYTRGRTDKTADAALLREQKVQDETKVQLTPEQVATYGFRPGTVASVDSFGNVTVDQEPDTMSKEALKQKLQIAAAGRSSQGGRSPTPALLQADARAIQKATEASNAAVPSVEALERSYAILSNPNSPANAALPEITFINSALSLFGNEKAKQQVTDANLLRATGDIAGIAALAGIGGSDTERELAVATRTAYAPRGTREQNKELTAKKLSAFRFAAEYPLLASNWIAKYGSLHPTFKDENGGTFTNYADKEYKRIRAEVKAMGGPAAPGQGAGGAAAPGGTGTANLPPGTVYSPSRKQYRDPSGKLYDQNGKPL